LDKDTSGAILFCKTKECFLEAIVNKKFKDSKKTYLAVVTGIPKFKTGKITFPLPSRENKRVLLPCTTKYKVIKEYRSGQVTTALVEAIISSGKFHQIREHMKMIRHPLFMDREYMDREDYKRYQKMVSLRHYLLHAHKIEFIHFVTNEPIEITCEPPAEFDLKKF
jgi:23S rRNA pseudouridine1911/1915/1917 synthase